jgi:tetratricopeptide (TPR) repeat protein
MGTAVQAGSHALVYCVQAGNYDRLGRFASKLVTGTTNPRLVENLLPYLEAAAAAAPEGKPQWSCLTYLADTLRTAGRPDVSLSFYEEAATLARAAAEAQGDDGRQAWSDLAWITGNWAIALVLTGNLNASRQRHLDSAKAEKKAGAPAVNVLTSELEALRIDIMQGHVSDALPEVETRLAQVEGWWRQYRSGRRPREAPELEFLARTFMGGLDIAKDAHLVQEDWESALRRIDTILEVERALERSEEDIAATRINRAVVLGRLGQIGEAKAELDACLQVFRNDPDARATTLSSLASLFNDQGDVPQAIKQERRALAIREQLSDPRNRAISHNNMSVYLDQLDTPEARTASASHQFAALIYHFVSGLGQQLQTSLHNYMIYFRRAYSTGTLQKVPRVAELLSDPAFQPLDSWLRDRGVNVTDLQVAIDQVLEKARRAALQA